MEPTFDVLTSHSREEDITTKLVQPPWFRLSKFLIYILFSISFVAGALKFQYDSFNCNVIECVYNETITSLQTCPQFKTQSLDADPTYNFISDKCRDQNVHWVFETIPFLYFIIAMILWNCSSLWLNIPSCTIYIERFVGLVKDCNAAIETSGWVYKDYLENWKKLKKVPEQTRPKSFSSCRKRKNEVSPGRATEDEKQCKELEQMQNNTSSGSDTVSAKNKDTITWHVYPEDKNQPKDQESEQLNNLHDRLSNMMNDKQNHHVSVVLVVQQSALTFLSLVFFFSVSCAFFWFDFLRSEYTCILEEYSRVECYYRLYTIYWFLAILFCICICFHCFLSCVHLCWVIYHSTTHVESTFVPLDGPLPRDLSLLLNLVMTNDRFFCERVNIFMGKYSKNEVTFQVTLSFENLEKLAQSTGGKQLTLYNLTRRPQSFDRLHQLKYLQVLHLINCSLDEIPRCILECETLERADFTCNKIEAILPNSQTSNDTTKINTLILDKNPVITSTLKHLETWPIRSVSFVEYPAHEVEKGKFAKKLHKIMRNKQISVCIDEQLFKQIQKLDDFVDFKGGKDEKECKVVYRVQNRYDVKRSIVKLRECFSPMYRSLVHQLSMLEKALDLSNESRKVVDEFKVLKDLYKPHSDRLGKKCAEMVEALAKQIYMNFEHYKCYREKLEPSSEPQKPDIYMEDQHFQTILKIS
ncbi:volume-regulated anion channel subunit LRRC8A-like [Argopecten irradians]|uniref:volume-regulated anion channel subunit LRRC8A-like n=1 Tax=Argopecten irradians TaxID=31199 RepID=UPI00371F86C5